jgi:hypothetical protein
MVRELSDGESAPMQHQVPKYVKLAMFEGKYGFLLEPICIITGQKVEINRIRIPEKRRTLLENVYGGQETWQVQVWEYAEGYDSKTPTWMITFDPETTYEEAEKEAASVRETYGDWERSERIAQAFRPGEPRISLPAEKPPIDLAKESIQLAKEMNRRYEILREERSARFKVLSVILPKTVELAEKAEQIANDESRQELEKESLEAYFAENAPGWWPMVFKAWQHLNPIGLKWMQWLYVWNSRQMKRRKEINDVDYELAFNWRWKRYYSLTAEQLRDEIQKETKQSLSPEAIKKRRERLGLTTQRPPGPPPKQLESIV